VHGKVNGGEVEVERRAEVGGWRAESGGWREKGTSTTGRGSEGMRERRDRGSEQLEVNGG
jgi:hypothetical protein